MTEALNTKHCNSPSQKKQQIMNNYINTTKPLQHQTLQCLARNTRHANKSNTTWTSNMNMTDALQSNNCDVSSEKLVKSKTENTT